MGTAASNVNLTVTYKGFDQTTKAGKSARKSIKGIGKEAGKAKKQIASLRGGVSSLASGDLLGGLKPLRSTFGGGGLKRFVLPDFRRRAPRGGNG